jgi:hypothetical protein
LGANEFAKLGRMMSREREGTFSRHCEARSDEAIQLSFVALDCFANARNDDVGVIAQLSPNPELRP